MLSALVILPCLVLSAHFDTPQIARLIPGKPVNCSQVATAVDRKTVDDLIKSAPVVVFGFGPCPCTDFARERFDELSVCYAESVQPMLFSNDEPHLKYLQCKYGVVHSFTFIGGELVGDSRGMVDKDTVSPAALETLLKKAGASYMCPKTPEEMHHPEFGGDEPSVEMQMTQIAATATQPAAGELVLEKSTVQGRKKLVHRLRPSETTLGVATLASVGTLVFASMMVAATLVVRRVSRGVRASTDVSRQAQIQRETTPNPASPSAVGSVATMLATDGTAFV